MEKGEREVGELEGREGRRGEGGKAGMGVQRPDQVREEIDVRAYISSNIKTIGLLPAGYNVCHCQRHLKLPPPLLLATALISNRPLGISHTKPYNLVSSSSSFGAIDVAMVDMTSNDL